MRKLEGFTLIELLVTIAVAAIVLSLAVPSFQSFANNSRAVTLTNELVAALNFARSEAIKRGVDVTVCKTANPNDTSPDCTDSGGWETGWLIFTDSSPRGDPNDPVSDTRLRVKQPTGGSGTIDGGSNFGSYVTYRPSGESLGSVFGSGTGTLKICVNNVIRNIKIINTGRIRIDKTGTCP